MEESMEGKDALYAEAGVDTAAVKTAISDMRTANAAFLKNAQAINDKYDVAVTKKATEKELTATRDEAKAMNAKTMNAKTLAAYQEGNDAFIAMNGGSSCCMFNEIPQKNIPVLDEMIAGIKNNDRGPFMRNAWQLDSLTTGILQLRKKRKQLHGTFQTATVC